MENDQHLSLSFFPCHTDSTCHDHTQSLYSNRNVFIYVSEHYERDYWPCQTTKAGVDFKLSYKTSWNFNGDGKLPTDFLHNYDMKLLFICFNGCLARVAAVH